MSNNTPQTDEVALVLQQRADGALRLRLVTAFGGRCSAHDVCTLSDTPINRAWFAAFARIFGAPLQDACEELTEDHAGPR